MGIEANPATLNTLSKIISPIEIGETEYSLISNLIKDSNIVLLGEATHGTQEFYESRAAITRGLIADKQFNLIAIEADWPDAYYLNRYVRGQLGDAIPNIALSKFKRFPEWLWRNEVMLNFITWLKAYNDPLPSMQKIGIYGLDLYSLFSSIAEVIGYLEQVDPLAAKSARERYGCFNSFSDPQHYGFEFRHDLEQGCVKAVLDQLAEIQRQAKCYSHDGNFAKEEYFHAEQNANLIKNAERYYRSLFKNDASSWNIRDQHMADTLDSVMQHLWGYKLEPKAIVWAHNSHIGDARATQMGEYGELNLGQLLRERYGHKVFSLGYSTYQGEVLAASTWGQAPVIQAVRNALPNSYENVFHQLKIPNFLLDIKSQQAQLPFLVDYLQRAIGVVYRPETERYSHYYYADLLGQFDVLLHFDKTSALRALDTNNQTAFGHLVKEPATIE